MPKDEQGNEIPVGTQGCALEACGDHFHVVVREMTPDGPMRLLESPPIDFLRGQLAMMALMNLGEAENKPLTELEPVRMYFTPVSLPEGLDLPNYGTDLNLN